MLKSKIPKICSPTLVFFSSTSASTSASTTTSATKQAAASRLFTKLSQLIEKRDRPAICRFLDDLQHNPDLSKSDRFDLHLQANCLMFNADGIKKTLLEMHESGVKPGRVALRALIQYHVANKDLEGAEQLCLSLPKYGESSLDAYMTSTMIVGWGRNGQVERAEQLYRRCPELHNQVVLVTSMMSVFYAAKQYDRALSLFDSLTAVKPDAVMRKLRSRCLFLIGNHNGAVTEWLKIQSSLNAHHWLDMARLFVDGRPDAVVRMAKEGLACFGVAKDVPELVALAIRKACQSEEEVKQLYTLASMYKSASGEGMEATALVAVADRLVDFPTMRTFCREQLSRLEATMPPLCRLTVQSKLQITL